MVVVASIVLGVVVRASATKMPDPFGLESPGSLASPSAASATAQAWTMVACVLAGAGVLTWTAKEARGVVEVTQGPKAEPQGDAAAVVDQDRPDVEERPEDEIGPVWDPLQISADADGQRWRSLEIKHGHLSMLVHAGLVATRQHSSSAPSSDVESSGSTHSPEQSLALGDSSALESSSDIDAPTASDSEEGGQQTPAQDAAAGWPEAAAACEAPASGDVNVDVDGHAEAREPCEEVMEDDAVDSAQEPASSKPSLGKDVEVSQTEEIDQAVVGEPEFAFVVKTAEEPLFAVPRGSVWSDFVSDGERSEAQPDPEPEVSAAAEVANCSLFTSFPRGSVWSDFDDETAFPDPFPEAAAQCAPEPREDFNPPAPAEAPGLSPPSTRSTESVAEAAEVESILHSIPKGAVWSALTEDDLPDAGDEEVESIPHSIPKGAVWSALAEDDLPDAGAELGLRSGGSPGATAEDDLPDAGADLPRCVSAPPPSDHSAPRSEDVPAAFLPPEKPQKPKRGSIRKPRGSRKSSQKQQAQAQGDDTAVRSDVCMEEWQQNPPEAHKQTGPSCSSRPALRKPRKNQTDKDLKMPEILRCLESVDQEQIIIVRKMKKLGFNSAGILRTYFEEFGVVLNVYVSHSHLVARMRPSSLGFVVMGTREARQAALELGTQQTVQGVPVFMGAFEQLERGQDLEE